MNNQSMTRQANTAITLAGNPGTLEARDARVRRLYSAPGGALMGWLYDQASTRGDSQHQLAHHLGVTVGYLHQLKSGVRHCKNISHEFAVACARYLLVPVVVVKVIAGQIRLSDFAWPNMTEEELVEQAFQRLRSDPVVMTALPQQLDSLNYEGRRALVMLYSEVSCQDLFALREIPETVRWLQRAAVLHNESEADALYGHRDISH